MSANRGSYPGNERRKYMRLEYSGAVEYREEGKESSATGKARNISVSGLMFCSSSAPAVGSSLWLKLDVKDLLICREIERDVMIRDDGIIGRVVRVEERPDGLYDIGVCFSLNRRRGRR